MHWLGKDRDLGLCYPGRFGQAFSQTARVFPGHDNGQCNILRLTTLQKNLLILAAITNVDPETGDMAGKEAEEESEVEEQLVAVVVTHAQSSAVPATSG